MRDIAVVIACTILAAAAGLSGLQPQWTIYRRADWPHWVDADRDCQDTRQEVLIAESRVTVTLSDEGCRVVSGEWLSYYDGELLTVPSALDVDHMVPLAHAYRSGAASWSRDRKRAYANDLDAPEHLVAVTASANRQKGDRGPDEWRPPREAARCRYSGEWMLVKLRWGLAVTAPELVALREMAATCPR